MEYDDKRGGWYHEGVLVGSDRKPIRTKVREVESPEDLPPEAFPGDLCKTPDGTYWIFLTGWHDLKALAANPEKLNGILSKETRSA